MKNIAIGQAIQAFRREKNLTQEELANRIPIDRTALARIESGERPLPSGFDSVVSSLSWKLALEIADARTGGYISNILEDVPNLDLHPAALKDLLLKQLAEAGTALERLSMSKHISPEKRKESAKKVWQEIRDVIETGNVMQGVLEDEFGLERK
ncbi:helix-turn-helix domain-containing protein [Paenibacillus sp. HWE-109]|uniref:helix-turn-helix transcriptional regulator n=1 Tax=Paenibacillus sp. HWE-109 TaxID=1306526 RepID=UPI001EE1026D|nr:helix-turn-helix transcriptional regulator [Paenibacillus sp. HWE-109]UKS29943.1 helix-turn-helix domain-containing protein [Paenibacillus sp. HWE-109]